MLKKILSLFILVSLLFTACDQEDIQRSRERWLKNSDEIVIGLAYPTEAIEQETYFLDGINMALEEVNEINRNGMVMISPASTSTDLAANGYDYIFSMINNDMDYAGILAKYAMNENLDRVVIYYEADDYGRGLANNFEEAADDNGIDVVDRISSISNRNIDELIRKWKALDYNAVLVADAMDSAVDVIRILKQSGIEVPILGATGIDIISLLPSLDNYAEDIVVPTLFNPTADRTETIDFVQKYEKIYGHLPDSWAAQGYDSVKVLCKAMEAAGSAMPDQFVNELRKTTGYQGASGEVSCNSKGEITASDMYIKLVHNNEYIYTDIFKLEN